MRKMSAFYKLSEIVCMCSMISDAFGNMVWGDIQHESMTGRGRSPRSLAKRTKGRRSLSLNCLNIHAPFSSKFGGCVVKGLQSSGCVCFMRWLALVSPLKIISKRSALQLEQMAVHDVGECNAAASLKEPENTDVYYQVLFFNTTTRL